MALSYAEQKILEVLRLNQNSRAKAAKQVKETLYQDHRFLLELTLPYMTGIIAHAISRVEGKISEGSDVEAGDAQLELQDLNLVGVSAPPANDKAGKEMLRTFAAQDTAMFGFEHSNRTAPVKRKAASQKHVDTIHLLAAKAKDKLDRLP